MEVKIDTSKPIEKKMDAERGLAIYAHDGDRTASCDDFRRVPKPSGYELLFLARDVSALCRDLLLSDC